MVKNKRCCVGPCDNDTRYPQKLVKRNTVSDIKWHKLPSYGDIEKVRIKREKWIQAIQKDRADFVPDTHANHYVSHV